MEAKIRQRRFVTGDEVREACIPDAYDRAGWEDDPEHGRRLLVIRRTAQGRPLKVVLQPIDVREASGGSGRSCSLPNLGHSFTSDRAS